MRIKPSLATLLALALATPLQAQMSGVAEPPTCTQMQRLRIGVMPPPEANTATLRREMMERGVFPEGTEIVFVRADQAPPIVGERKKLSDDLTSVLYELQRVDHVIVQGDVVSVLSIDADGEVVDVAPGAHQRQVDHALSDFWKRQHFRPLVRDGCRMQALIRVPFNFKMEDRGVERRTYLHIDYPVAEPAF